MQSRCYSAEDDSSQLKLLWQNLNNELASKIAEQRSVIAYQGIVSQAS
jgi:hypothetical protein